jgi:hypothetical protein
MSNVFRFTAFLALSLLFPCAASERASGQQEVSIKVKTELVQLRAVVTDRRGQLIDNLSKADFVLLEDGKPQDVSFFSLERVGAEAFPQQAPAHRQLQRTRPGRPLTPPGARSLPDRWSCW